jgi:hypothetical protein
MFRVDAGDFCVQTTVHHCPGEISRRYSPEREQRGIACRGQPGLASR